MSKSALWLGVGVVFIILAFTTTLMAIFLLLGLICGVVGFILLKSEGYDVKPAPTETRTLFADTPAPHPKHTASAAVNSLSILNAPKGGSMILPARWDESAIRLRLDQLRVESPNIVSHYLSSVYERFIIGQEQKTAQHRIHFIQAQINQLKLAVEWQQTMDNMELLSKEKLKRSKTLDQEAREIEQRREESERLHELGLQQKELERQLQIAKIQKELDELRAPKRSPEEEREQNLIKAEARLRRHEQDKKAALTRILQGHRFEELAEDEQEHYREEENFWTETLRADREKLRKLQL